MSKSDFPPYRWVVLGIYAWIAGLSQLLWLNFAPILSSIQETFKIPESTASLLLLVFPLTYVLLSVHSGTLIDRKGYRYSIGLGAVLMALFSCLRIYTGNFWILLAAQTGISLGQPYILNGITKLVFDWFAPAHAALATGLGTVGLFVGMALGMALTPPLVEAMGLSGAMAAQAGITCVSCALFFLLCKERNTAISALPSSAISGAFWARMRERNLLLLSFISFVGLGYFNGLTSWIEAILAPNGIRSAEAGILGGVMIVGGIFGSILIPALSDRMRNRKLFLILSILAAGLTLIPLCLGRNYSSLLVWSFFQGFFFLPSYALLLDMTSLEAGENLAGSATGVLMLTGNAGGVLAILLLGWLKGDRPEFSAALYFLLALLVAALGAAFLTREPLRK